jgi:hypothetical protein
MSESQKVTHPRWIQGKRIVSPLANDVLIAFRCGYGLKTLIAGYRVSTNDPKGNIYTLTWLHNGQEVSCAPDVTNSRAVVQNQSDLVLVNENTPCDAGSIITIKIEENATDGFHYHADLCIIEEVMK